MNPRNSNLQKRLEINETLTKKLIAFEEMIYEQTADSLVINQVMEIYTVN